MTRLLGIDLGERRIGIAIADSTTGEIRPLTTLHRSTPQHDGASIGRIAIEQRAADALLVLCEPSASGDDCEPSLAVQPNLQVAIPSDG